MTDKSGYEDEQCVIKMIKAKREKRVEKIAAEYWEMFSALRAVGFSEDQAMRLMLLAVEIN